MLIQWDASRIVLAIKPGLIKCRVGRLQSANTPHSFIRLNTRISTVLSFSTFQEQKSESTVNSILQRTSYESSQSLLNSSTGKIRSTRYSKHVGNRVQDGGIASSCSRSGLIKSKMNPSMVLAPPQLHARPRMSFIHEFHSSAAAMKDDPIPNGNKDNTHEHEHHHSNGLNSHEHEHQHSNDPSHKHEHEHGHEHEHSHSLFGHSHSHSAADSIFVQEHGGLKNPAIRITWIGLLSNVGMAIGKGVGGIVFHSQALLADSIHSLSDLVSDFLTLATISVAARKPTPDFPHGYGKIETLGSLGVSALLLLAGISVGWSGLISILQQLLSDSHALDVFTQLFGHGHSHSHVGAVTDAAAATSVATDTATTAIAVAPKVDLNAMWLAIGSILIKEWLFQATMKIAKSTNSNVLVANAWHHRVDSLTSLVAVVTIGGSYFLGLNWIDSLGGLLVSILIIRAGYKNGYTAALELADSSKTVPLDVIDANTEAVRTALTRAVAHKTIKLGDFDINNVTIMSSGPNYSSSVTLKTYPTMDTKTATMISRFIENDLLARDPRLKYISVKCVDSGFLNQDQSLTNQK